MDDFFLSQVIAAVAFACGVIAFQCKARRAVLLWLAVSGVANACHYFILDRPAAGALFVVLATRSLAAAFSVNRKVMFLFFGRIVAAFCFSYKDPIEFLGLFATLSATYGNFQHTAPRVRATLMLSNVTWMTHDLVVGTPVAALMQATFLASNVIGYWRYRKGDANDT